MDKLTPVELVESLDSPNEWQRDKAHMAFSRWWLGPGAASSKKERDRVGTALKTALTHRSPLVRLHTMCLLGGIKLPPGVREALLRDSDVGVRENSLRQTEKIFYLRNIIGINFGDIFKTTVSLAEDIDPKVRLQLALCLGELTMGMHPDSRVLGTVLAKLAIRDHADPWIRAAVMSSAVPHCRALCEGIAAEGGEAFAAYADDLTLTALGLNDRDSLAAMLRPSVTAKDGHFTAAQIAMISRLLEALQKKNLTRNVLADKSDELSKTLHAADAAFSFSVRVAGDAAASTELRAAAAGLLIREEATRQKAVDHCATWLSAGNEGALQLAAVRTLATVGEPSVPGILLRSFSSLTPQTRSAAVEALLSREAWAVALLDHAKTGSGLELDAVQRARLMQHSSKKVRDLAASVLKSESSRKEVLEQFRPALQLKGDTARGKTVFTTRCIACHKVDDAGIDIGPDLKSVAAHPPEKILTNIIDPSLDVQPGFFAFQATLKDGSELYGLVTSETGNSVTFKLTDGSTRLVLRSDLADFKSTGQSLMPAGLETGMTVQEMADLIAWLRRA
jgi:putative heme-binding domain-containing protein